MVRGPGWRVLPRSSSGASGNRDEDVIEHADRFIIDRARPRRHPLFGFCIHRCVGNRLAERHLTILRAEVMARFPAIGSRHHLGVIRLRQGPVTQTDRVPQCQTKAATAAAKRATSCSVL